MRIFLSYRRDDSAFASQAIFERLQRRFGPRSVFIDVESIPPGVDFREHISRSIAECQLLLAIIGPDWLARAGAAGPRLEDPVSFVRIEIETALRLGIPVLPVLVGKATMPAEASLPDALRPLVYRHALQVRPGRDFQTDIESVMRAVADLATVGSPGFAGHPGDEHVTATGIREVVLPAGTFLMGSADGDPHASADEKPLRRVRIPQALWMSVTPITQGEFELIMAFNPSKHLGDALRPVETVSLADAAEFCNALGRSEGLLPFYEILGQRVAAIGGPGYRLPRESEWEYACRAGTTTRWSFGDDDAEAGAYAWFADNAEDSPQATGRKLPNPWGLHDMHGNVWELCWGLGEGGQERETLPAALAPPAECVLRGGCFADPPWGIRSAYRSSVRVSVRSNRVGFRVVREGAPG